MVISYRTLTGSPTHCRDGLGRCQARAWWGAPLRRHDLGGVILPEKSGVWGFNQEKNNINTVEKPWNNHGTIMENRNNGTHGVLSITNWDWLRFTMEQMMNSGGSKLKRIKTEKWWFNHHICGTLRWSKQLKYGWFFTIFGSLLKILGKCDLPIRQLL